MEARVWGRLAVVAEEQHGLIAKHQLDEIEVSRHVLARWVAHDRLEKTAARVWRVVGTPVTWEHRLMRGLLSLGPEALVSHDAAAALHRFDRTPPGRVEFLVANCCRTPRLGETVHSSKLIQPWDAVKVDGFRVTSATRTVLDLANKQVHPDRVRAAIDTAIRSQMTAPQVLAERLYDIRRRGRTGVRLMDELLLDTGGHTMLERKFLELMRLADLPRPAPQVVFKDERRTIARVDFLYAEWKIVVEVSGELGHSTPTERARDAHRRNELQALGYKVFEFTWHDVSERGTWVQLQIRSHLRAAGWPR